MTQQRSTTVLAATTALAAVIGASGGPAPAADADRIQIRIEGDFQQWGVLADQNPKSGDGTNVDTSTLDQKHNSTLYFTGQVELESGITVGLTVGLEANTDDNQISESFMFLEHDAFGLLELGDTDNVANKLHVGAPTGGVTVNDGDLVGIEAFALPAGYDTGNTLIDTTLLNLGDDTSGKFNYFSPRVAGFQVGLSFIPQFEDGGSDNNSISRVGNEGPIQNGFAAAVNFSEEFDDVGVEAYAGYLFGDTPAAAGSSNVHGAGAGVMVSVAGFEVGGSFAWANGDKPDDESFDGYAYDVGVAYEVGPWRVGITYLRGVSEGSRADSRKQRLDQGVISATYRVGPGVDLVGGLFVYDADGEKQLVAGTDEIRDNNGYGFATGFKLSF